MSSSKSIPNKANYHRVSSGSRYIGITKSASVIGSATLLSRVLGMFRDILMASFFGTGIYAQAFFVAFRIPNLMRELVGEGATNSAIVPAMVEELAKRGKREFWKSANILLNFLLIVLSMITLLGFLLAPQIIQLTAPGFLADPDKFRITVSLTRLMFPYLILIGMAAYGMGLLNSLHHFVAPALGPSLLNFSLIACMFMFKSDVMGLAIGVLLGGLFQVLVQVYPLIKRGISFKEKKLFNPLVAKVGKLLAPRTLGAGIYQINVIVTQILASFGRLVGSNAVAILWYSNRIMQLPLAIIGHAIAQASLPALSMHAVKGDINKLKNTVAFLIRVVVFALAPATVGLVILNKPIVKILFERGAFTPAATLLTANALAFYAIGLVACGGIKILTSTYYSMQDTVTPVKLSGLSLIVNIVLNIIFMYPLKASGLAFANSLAAILHVIMLYIFLVKKIGHILNIKLFISLLKVGLASILMGLVCWLSFYTFSSNFPLGLKYLIINVFITIVISIISYGAFTHFLGIKETKNLILWILRKK